TSDAQSAGRGPCVPRGRARPGHPRLCCRRIDNTAILVSMAGWVYIMTNRRNGTLYVGTTVNLARRVWEHREGVADGFTKQYGLRRLVYAEHHTNILSAKQREMNIKHWPRAWNVRLIHQENPD